jgi:hypothetical protein
MDLELVYFIFCAIYLVVGVVYFSCKNEDLVLLFTGIPRKKITRPQAIHFMGWLVLVAIWAVVFVSGMKIDITVSYFLCMVMYLGIGVFLSAIKNENLFRLLTTLKWQGLSKLQLIYGVGLLLLLAGWVYVVLNR